MLDPIHIDITRYVVTTLGGAAVLFFICMFIKLWAIDRADKRNGRR